MRRKYWVTGGVIVAVLILFLIILIPVAKHKISTTPSLSRDVLGKVPVEVVNAGVFKFEDVIGASGAIKEISTVRLDAKISARVMDVYVDLGSMVKSGQVLLNFDTSLTDAALLSARDYVNKTKSALENKENLLNRIRVLYEQRIVALAEVESADADYKSAVYNQSDALYKLRKAESDSLYTKVTAPVAGVIMEREISPGEIPAVNRSLFTIGRIDNVVFEAMVSQESAGEIQKDQEAEVTFDAFPNMIKKGTIVKIDPVSAPKTRTFSAFIKLNNSDLKLKPGLIGFARIKRSFSSLAIPSISVIAPVGAGDATVFAADKDHVAHLRRISTGVTSQGMTEVLNGLQAGDSVVVVGQLHLKDGDRVSLDTKHSLLLNQK